MRDVKFWLAKSSEVPLQEQLTTQMILGIVSADLAPGEHLPSTSQVARLFRIHPNTVRAAYRDLVRRGWVEWRRGSGFYVRTFNTENRMDPGMDLDQLISRFFQVAREKGYSLTEIQSRMARWVSLQPPDHIVVIEPDAELRAILLAEIRAQIPLPVEGIDADASLDNTRRTGAFCVALYDNAPRIQADLFLHSRSVSKSLTDELRPDPDASIQVVSRWPDFLQWAKTTLVAMGINPIEVSLHDARKKGWQRGLSTRDFIFADTVMSKQFPSRWKPHIFRVIADESMAELKRLLQRPSIKRNDGPE